MKIFDALMAIGVVVMMLLAAHVIWRQLFPRPGHFVRKNPADLFDKDGNLKIDP